MTKASWILGGLAAATVLFIMSGLAYQERFSREESLAQPRKHVPPPKTFEDVISAIKRRFFETGHCDIHTYDEKLLQSRPRLAENAVIIAGGLRTFLDVWSSQWRTLFQPNDMDLYLYVKMSPKPTAADCFSLIPPLATGRVRALVVNRLTLEEIVDQALHVDNVTALFPYRDAKGIGMRYRPKILVQFWMLYKAHEVYSKVRSHHRYKVVIKLRPDIYFGNRANKINLGHFNQGLMNLTSVGTPFISMTNCDHWEGLNDQYALMDSDTADLYFASIKSWDKYSQEGVKIYQEPLLEQHLLVANNVTYYPIESVLGLGEKNFEYCLRRITICRVCSRQKRIVDYPPECKY